MTDKEATAWLKYESERTGKTIAEIKAIMRERSAKANRTNSGFKSMTPERRSEVAKKGYDAGLGKKLGSDASG